MPSAQASKAINLSEDVFAGYKTVLRGGRIVFREYHQVGKGRMTNLAEIAAFFAKLSQGAACQLMSRDLYRLTKALPLERPMLVSKHFHQPLRLLWLLLPPARNPAGTAFRSWAIIHGYWW